MAGAPSIVPAHSKRFASDFGKADWLRRVNVYPARGGGSSQSREKKTSGRFNQNYAIVVKLVIRTIKVISSLLSLLNVA